MASSRVPTEPENPEAARRVHAARHHGRRRKKTYGRQPSARLADLLIAGAGGIGAAFADCRPTGWRPSDAVLTAAFAIMVSLLAAKARRWTWLVMALVVALTARGNHLIAAAGATVGIALIASVGVRRRNRVLGAAVGATAVQVLVRMPPFWFDGASALLAAAAVAPACVSGWRRLHDRPAHALHVALAVLGGAAAVLSLVFGVAALSGRSHLLAGADAAQRGFDAVRDGDQDVARTELRRAADEFERARSALRAPWVRPAAAVPITGQHLEAAVAMAESGGELATVAYDAAGVARYEDLRTEGGQVNLTLLQSMRAPVADTAAALEAAAGRLGAADGGWLLPAVADPLRRFRDEVEGALPDARLAVQAVDTAPSLLGADGPRRYLLLFANPAESRSLGGFVGSYGELTAVGGKITLTRSGRITELSDAPGYERRRIEAPPGFADRYSRWFPARFLQNLTVSPDFPSDAQVARDLYRQTTTLAVDGVIYVDPEGLAALLRLTGQVSVEGLAQPLTADNVASFLVRDQYVTVTDLGVRNDLLAEVSRSTFDALTTRALPGPRSLANALGPAVREGHVLFTTFAEAERGFLDALGTRGEFRRRPGSELVSLRSANMGGNKLDAYLHRDISYAARFDPETGAATATVTVRLRNDVPPGLPDYAVGDHPGSPVETPEPPGTNRTLLTLYSGLLLDRVTVDGLPAGVQSQAELGALAYTAALLVPSGGEVVVRFDLHGVLRAGDRLGIDLGHQPLVHDDHVTVRVAAAPGGWAVVGGGGVQLAGGEAFADLVVREPVTLTVDFARRGG